MGLPYYFTLFPDSMLSDLFRQFMLRHNKLELLTRTSFFTQG